MSTRREFIGSMVTGAAALASSRSFASNRVSGANDRVRIGLIGAGGRGQEIFKTALKCPNTEAVAVADVFTDRLEQVQKYSPSIKTYRDFRQLLDDKSIDAVLIATPQHLHSLNFVAAIQAGKDIYQEKTMAFSPDHARSMKKAMQGASRIVQIGIQSTSGPAVQEASESLRQERMGVITSIHTHHYRNAPYGGWKRKIPQNCDPQHFDWNAFQGDAKKFPFDANRAINWRFYWEYSGGNVFENMVHQVGFWYKLMKLTIPIDVTMTGGNYLSPDMQVPDTMNVSMHQSENLLFTWNSMFGNDYYGECDDLVLGNKGTLHRTSEDKVAYQPQGGRTASRESRAASDKAPDIVGGSDSTLAHMQNFFDCVRSRKEPNCPFEIGFRSAIACQMAIVSYRQGRSVRWDAKAEEVV